MTVLLHTLIKNPLNSTKDLEVFEKDLSEIKTQLIEDSPRTKRIMTDQSIRLAEAFIRKFLLRYEAEKNRSGYEQKQLMTACARFLNITHSQLGVTSSLRTFRLVNELTTYLFNLKFEKRTVNSENEAAQLILISGSFTNDLCDPLIYDNGLSRGQGQGNINLRVTAAILGRKLPGSLSYNVLRNHKPINLENYYFLVLKNISHSLTLKGKILLNNDKEINLECFSEEFTIPMLFSSFQSFYSTYAYQCDLFQNKLSTFLSKILSSDYTTRQELTKMADQLSKEDFVGPIGVSSGHDWHGFPIVFFRNYMIVADRQCMNNNPKSPIKVFKIDRTKITSELLERIVKRQFYTYSLLDIPKLNALGETLIASIDKTCQKAGNCTRANFKMLILIFHTIHLLDIAISSPEIDAQSWIDTFELSRPLYKNWTKSDRQQAIDTLLIEIQPYLNNPETTESNSLMFLGLTSIFFSFIAEKSHRIFSHFSKPNLTALLNEIIPILSNLLGKDSTLGSKQFTMLCVVMNCISKSYALNPMVWQESDTQIEKLKDSLLMCLTSLLVRGKSTMANSLMPSFQSLSQANSENNENVIRKNSQVNITKNPAAAKTTYFGDCIDILANLYAGDYNHDILESFQRLINLIVGSTLDLSITQKASLTKKAKEISQKICVVEISNKNLVERSSKKQKCNDYTRY